MAIFNWLMTNWVEILAVLGGLRLAAAAITRLTPNKEDDALVAKMSSWLDKLGSLFLAKPAAK